MVNAVQGAGLKNLRHRFDSYSRHKKEVGHVPAFFVFLTPVLDFGTISYMEFISGVLSLFAILLLVATVLVLCFQNAYKLILFLIVPVISFSLAFAGVVVIIEIFVSYGVAKPIFDIWWAAWFFPAVFTIISSLFILFRKQTPSNREFKI